jgi:hypothetical protein
MEIMAAAAIGAQPRRQGNSAKILDLTDFFGRRRLLTGPKEWSRANFDSSMAELAPTLDEAGLRDTHFDDGAFESRDDIYASTLLVERRSLAAAM